MCATDCGTCPNCGTKVFYDADTDTRDTVAFHAECLAEHDRQVIEKFLREQHSPKFRIENPEFIIPFLAKAWREGFTTGQSRAMRHMSDEPLLPLPAPNPYTEKKEAHRD